MGDLYYHPEKYGLETVGEVDWIQEGYEFDLTVVWRDAAGALYWADDNGCSCPTPFEYVAEVSELSTGTPDALHAHLRGRTETDTRRPRGADVQVAELMARVRA